MIDVEKPVQSHRTDIDVFSPEDAVALVRAAASEQEAAIYPTAALRLERTRDNVFTMVATASSQTLVARGGGAPAHPRWT